MAQVSATKVYIGSSSYRFKDTEEMADKVRGMVVHRLRPLVGKRVQVDIDEPSEFARDNENIRRGVIVRALTESNVQGHPYNVLILQLDEPVSYAGHQSDVIGLTARYSKHEFEELMSWHGVPLNITLEHRWALTAPESDPRLADPGASFYLGYGTARLERVERGAKPGTT